VGRPDGVWPGNPGQDEQGDKAERIAHGDPLREGKFPGAPAACCFSSNHRRPDSALGHGPGLRPRWHANTGGHYCITTGWCNRLPTSAGFNPVDLASVHVDVVVALSRSHTVWRRRQANILKFRPLVAAPA